ncbi:MAG: DUF5658 family protein [Nitrososphaerales archaeon]
MQINSSDLENQTEQPQQEKLWIEKLDVAKLDNALWVLYILFICLNFLDIFSTSLVLGQTQNFHENNILAARLFAMNLPGFLLAVVLKFAPAFPLFYIVFLKESTSKHSFQVRIIKVSALFALIVGDIFYGAVVFLNNIPQLLSHESSLFLIANLLS